MDRVDELIANLEGSLATARAKRLEAVGAPEGWEHVGWIDEHGNLYGVKLRNGAVVTDRPVFAPPRRAE